MTVLNDAMMAYKKQLANGNIQTAYKGLMSYLKDLKIHFNNNYPDWDVPANFYQGQMDLSFFAFTSKLIKDHKLKIMVVFLHERCEFELWLCGVNKGVQAEYWQLFKQSGWDKHSVTSDITGVDALVKSSLVSEPDFADLAMLTNQIGTRTMTFVKDIEQFLSGHNKPL